MFVTTTATLLIDGPQKRPFELAMDTNRFPEFFSGYGPIPGLEKIEWIQGPPNVPGSLCKAYSSDGSVVVEEVLLYKHPFRAVSRITGFEPPFSWVVRSAIGTWTFTAQGASTAVSWSYRFELTSALSYPAMKLLGLCFKRAMDKCLMAIAVAAREIPRARA